MPSSKMNGLIRLRALIAVDILLLISSTCLHHERWSYSRGLANLCFQDRVRVDLQYYRIQVKELKDTGAPEAGDCRWRQRRESLGTRLVTADIELCLSTPFTLFFSYF